MDMSSSICSQCQSCWCDVILNRSQIHPVFVSFSGRNTPDGGENSFKTRLCALLSQKASQKSDNSTSANPSTNIGTPKFCAVYINTSHLEEKNKFIFMHGGILYVQKYLRERSFLSAQQKLIKKVFCAIPKKHKIEIKEFNKRK